MCAITDHFQVEQSAPREAAITEYDRRHFYTYARLLEAERDGLDWRIAAADTLHLDMAQNLDVVKCCWFSHLERARWIIDYGIAEIAQTMALESGT